MPVGVYEGDIGVFFENSKLFLKLLIICPEVVTGNLGDEFPTCLEQTIVVVVNESLVFLVVE